MKISIGKRLPEAKFLRMGIQGPEEIKLSHLTKDRKIILIGMPGAFTPTCSDHHLPSIIRNSKKIYKGGIDGILCIVVNDVHVAKAWSKQSGADKANISVLSDYDSQFTKAIGLEFSAPKIGLLNRLQRVFIIAENNVITYLQLEDKRGSCLLTSGEKILSIISKS